MAQYGKTPEFRKNLLDQLQKRNNRECKTFEEIISFNNRLFLCVDQLKIENVQLNVQKEKLQQEALECQMNADSGGGKTSLSSGMLDKKVFQLQEEVAELLRRKSEHAQQILDVKNTLEEKEKELFAKNSRLIETEASLATATIACKKLEKDVAELQSTSQILKDEHEALQLAFSSLEDKHLKLEKEHTELVSRWIALRNRDVERLNAENEQERKMRQEKMRKELEDAAREQPVIIEQSELDKFYVPICVVASLPTRAIQKFDAHEGEVNAVIWSPTGKMIATGGGDRKVKLWEVNHGEVICRSILTGSSGSVMSVDFDLEETLVIGGSCDYASRIWTVNDGRLRHTLTGHGGKVFTAKFLAEPSKVITGSHDRTLKLWDLRSRACIKTIFAGSSCFDLVTSDGAGTTIISAHFDKKIRYFDTRSETSLDEIVLSARATSLCFSPDKNTLLACLRDDCLKLVDVRLNKVIKTFCHENFKVGCDWAKARFSPDASYITAGSSDGTIYFWDVNTGKLEKTLKEQDAVITGCAWDPKGTQLMTSDMSRKVVLWGAF